MTVNILSNNFLGMRRHLIAAQQLKLFFKNTPSLYNAVLQSTTILPSGFALPFSAKKK
jgi:hypothetical protein